MFTWWGLYKSVPYELALKQLGGEQESVCVELQALCEQGRESVAETGTRGGQGEDNGSRPDA